MVSLPLPAASPPSCSPCWGHALCIAKGRRPVPGLGARAVGGRGGRKMQARCEHAWHDHALSLGCGSLPQFHRPFLPLGGSRHVSVMCSVSRACSLLCPYLLEEVHTRVETEDEEVRATGRTYRTPRRLLAPSAALDEGRAPVSAPSSPGGLTTHPLPGACVSTSERPDTGAVVSVRRKWRLQSGRALSSPGSLPPPSVLEALEVPRQ